MRAARLISSHPQSSAVSSQRPWLDDPATNPDAGWTYMTLTGVVCDVQAGNVQGMLLRRRSVDRIWMKVWHVVLIFGSHSNDDVWFLWFFDVEGC